ncbi:hypothetical protein EMIHUDRAFT_439833 [Emiliania huxleyi CCMP1516]|uniref:RNB domain-containing protein n=2 Tax=Emiliania huxleyi TaxID=2903 RepID=A0A0D3KVU3_EMIH1|nr:hypothetical protein EMIHUDRAFT_439833 [Emiliania huxleyi CCMP1516]EOD39878.1 hypothetical protein EMIHUDRAFT_439833 [Emiliania huxleyi CCMP1516]|eukprot:XP_005792307.1 hypothetical protein EMIHUDRAFT_439833 [Emiliania huxleyi CCMP1516]
MFGWGEPGAGGGGDAREGCGGAEAVSEQLDHRVDLRARFPRAYAIDGGNTEFRDDAVSIDAASATIGVHIADLSSLVQPGSLLDEVARLRLQSLYAAAAPLHMLPPPLLAAAALSDDAPNECLTALVQLDLYGHIRHCQLVRSLVPPVRCLSFDEVRLIARRRRHDLRGPLRPHRPRRNLPAARGRRRKRRRRLGSSGRRRQRRRGGGGGGGVCAVEGDGGRRVAAGGDGAHVGSPSGRPGARHVLLRGEEGGACREHAAAAAGGAPARRHCAAASVRGPDRPAAAQRAAAGRGGDGGGRGGRDKRCRAREVGAPARRRDPLAAGGAAGLGPRPGRLAGARAGAQAPPGGVRAAGGAVLRRRRLGRSGAPPLRLGPILDSRRGRRQGCAAGRGRHRQAAARDGAAAGGHLPPRPRAVGRCARRALRWTRRCGRRRRAASRAAAGARQAGARPRALGRLGERAA